VAAWPLSTLVEVVAATNSSWTLRFVDWHEDGMASLQASAFGDLHLVDARSALHIHYIIGLDRAGFILHFESDVQENSRSTSSKLSPYLKLLHNQ